MRRHGKAIFGIAVGAAVGACAVDQAREVGEYREMAAVGARATLDAGEGLSLERALRLAAQDNERLAIEGENLVQALAAKQRSTAALLPTVDLFGTYAFRENVGDAGAGGGGASASNSKNTLFDGGFRAQYTLLTGMSDYATARSLDATIEQRRWMVLDLRETLLLDTARAYYTVMAAEQLVSVLESSAAVQAERLRDIRGRQEVGFARPLDVAQVESQASATAVSLLDAERAVRNARTSLSLLTAVSAGGVSLTDGFNPPDGALGERPDDGVIALAMEQRQDAIAADAAVRASRELVDAEIGRYYPTVTVNLEYFLTRQTVPSDRDWTGLLTLNLPLFSAGRIDADVRAAWSVFRQDLLTLSLTRRQIESDVRIAHEDLRSARLRVSELERQVRAAEEALRQAEASYAAGLGTNLERIAAQDQVLSAQLGLARERYVVKIANLALRRATGVLTESAIAGVPPLPKPRYQGVALPESPFVNLPGLSRPSSGE
ncbi:MAG: TolC family protein [Phycisphaerales bacterium]|nr:TolC family protein [Phycisphaerales bacterium]